MTPTTWLVLVVAIAITVLAAWAYFTAQRLDRLHIRLDRSRDALQAALDRRCAVLAAVRPELASQARATEECRLSPTDIHSRLEMEDALAEARGGTGHEDLVRADTRVLLALRFYNEAVADTRALRLRPAVRTLRLGGTAALPQFASLSQIAPE